FDQTWQPRSSCDVLVNYQAPATVPGSKNSDFHTLVVDLLADEKTLFSSMHENSRSRIRRARDKDRLAFRLIHVPTEDDVQAFAEFYDIFAKSKSLPEIWRPRLMAYMKSG